MKTLIKFLVLMLPAASINVCAQIDSSCITRISKKTVEGTSLEGVIKNGATVYLYYGFYTCNKPQRNDVVAYDYKGYKIPLIKLVKAIPGDTFKLVPSKNDRYNIIVNNDTLKEISGKPYQLKKGEYNMIHIYETEYKQKMPANTYLILGSHSGTTDSSRFGLIDIRDIFGKIIY